jgi:hypothetical protein
MRRSWLLLLVIALLAAIPLSAQQRQFSTIISVPEPLPNCTPGGLAAEMPVLWDVTSAGFKFCSGTNTWSPFPASSGGGGATIQTNGTSNGLQSILNFQNVGVFSWSNPSSGNEQLNFSSQSANTFIAAPNGSAGVPTARAIVAADIPAGTSCGANQFTNGILAALAPSCTQVNFVNLAGTIALGQTPLTTNGDLLSVSTGALARVGSAGGQDFLLQGANAALPVWLAVNNCGSATQALSYSTTSHAFGCQTISAGTGTINNASQFSAAYYSSAGTTNVISGIAGPTTPSIPFIFCSTPSGGVATAPAWCIPGVPLNEQTSASYPVVAGDRENLDTMNFATAVAVSLPQAGSAGFTNNFNFALTNIGAGLVTVTPGASSTINGNATQIVPKGWFSYIYSDYTNYFALTAPDISDFPNCANPLSFTAATGVFNCLAGTSGGIPYFSAANTWASSGVLTANLPVIGGGAGASPSVGTVTGNTTEFATWTGATTVSRCIDTDASGNLHITAADCGVGTTVPISGLLPATGTNTIDNAALEQIWEWEPTSGTPGLLLTESAASTGAGPIFGVTTIAGSLAKAMVIQGTAPASVASAPIAQPDLADFIAAKGQDVTGMNTVGGNGQGFSWTVGAAGASTGTANSASVGPWNVNFGGIPNTTKTQFWGQANFNYVFPQPWSSQVFSYTGNTNSGVGASSGAGLFLSNTSAANIGSVPNNGPPLFGTWSHLDIGGVDTNVSTLLSLGQTCTLPTSNSFPAITGDVGGAGGFICNILMTRGIKPGVGYAFCLQPGGVCMIADVASNPTLGQGGRFVGTGSNVALGGNVNSGQNGGVIIQANSPVGSQADVVIPNRSNAGALNIFGFTSINAAGGNGILDCGTVYGNTSSGGYYTDPSNTQGGTCIFRAGNGTGTATSGDLQFQTAPGGSSGAGQDTMVTRGGWNGTGGYPAAGGLIDVSLPGQISLTAQTAAISTATLCSGTTEGQCNHVGQYLLNFSFVEDGTACGTPGTGGVTFLLTWTDDNGTVHSAVSLGMDDASAINTVSQTFHFQTSLGAAWGSGQFVFSSNGSVVQYATGYTACGVGTGSYRLKATVTRLQ